jgi:LPPG:FO 2-phospho-L-lactate transferase
MSTGTTTSALTAPSGRFVALCGGVGGAKLALGLAALLEDRLTVVVNTGDDFEHLGLHISPDLDTVLYTLADVVNPESGWGRRGETWSFMSAIERLGGPTWFRLGDADLAVHVERTRRLRAGESLSAVTAHLSARFGVRAAIVPMSDQPVRTVVETDCGVLGFQEYFVRERCEPAVRRVSYEGAAAARPAVAIAGALASAELQGIILCPSNPWLSIDPILAIPGMRDLLTAASAPIIAVSPIIAGQAVKGPAAKIMGELGLVPNAATVASHYAGLIDGFVLDTADASLAPAIDAQILLTGTLMTTRDQKVALARDCLLFCQRLKEAAAPGGKPEAKRTGGRS